MLLEEVCNDHIPMQEAIILRELITWTTRDTGDLIDALYKNREDGGPNIPENCIKIYIYRLNLKLNKKWSINHVRSHLYILEKGKRRKAK